MLGALVFTAFAIATTQVHALRQGSPWQNDPYDAVVSFTELLVPALLVLVIARGWLYRRANSNPVFRVRQLLRATLVMTLLVAATSLTDWLAVALRADRALWDSDTLWLIVSLGLVTATTLVACVLLRRAFRDMPERDGRYPDGDWLDDLGPLADALAEHLPDRGRRVAGRFARNGAIGFVRTHFVALAAGASLVAALASTAGIAIGEGWTSPILIATDAIVGAGGFFAFCILCNFVLQIAVPRDTESTHHGARGRVRRAMRPAIVAGAVGLPVSAALRDSIWTLAGRSGEVDSPKEYAMVCVAGALLIAAIAYVVALARLRHQ